MGTPSITATPYSLLDCIHSGERPLVNAYDTFTGVTKDGKVQTIHGRTTLVFVKQGGQWKIVSAHFSPLPHA